MTWKTRENKDIQIRGILILCHGGGFTPPLRLHPPRAVSGEMWEEECWGCCALRRDALSVNIWAVLNGDALPGRSSFEGGMKFFEVDRETRGLPNQRNKTDNLGTSVECYCPVNQVVHYGPPPQQEGKTLDAVNFELCLIPENEKLHGVAIEGPIMTQ